ncbi:ketopantoate reductase family protein [Virgibacillus kekensis]|uniref:2-dehydropantoate 2-reductase n=1 Tax=Virgibacillus kekensis TaxID=202261 RepID=A0ABV9DPL5_9BACI
MHIVVLGAGALGGYFGARWEEAGAKVTFLVREKRAAQISNQGLKVISTRGDYLLEEPRVSTSPVEIENPDVVFVSVKGYHLEGTLESLKVLADKGAYILPVLNGIEHINVLQESLGKECVLGGLAFIAATLNEEGNIEHTSDFDRLIFGPLERKQNDICDRLLELSGTANFEPIKSDDILKELWKKYMFINALSGITTAVDLPIGPIRDQKETLYVAENILIEMKQLANSYGTNLDDHNVEQAKEQVKGFGYEATSSMHQDRRKGLPLELDHLHGGALRMARTKGISLPFTEAVYGIIKPFANTKN